MSDSVLVQLTHGKGAHTDATACVEGLSAETAGAIPAGAPNSIFQIVFHINYWIDYELRSIAGPEASYPEHANDSWPAQTAPRDAVQWEREVRRFRDQVGKMVELAGRLSKDGLATRMVHLRKGETVEDVLWQMVAHNSYHTGQIATLRRAFGAWPPAGGGPPSLPSPSSSWLAAPTAASACWSTRWYWKERCSA